MRNPQFVRKNGARLGVQKTYKLLIGGKFVRSESGRVAAAAGSNGKTVANYSRARSVRRLVEAECLFAQPDFVSRRGNAGDARRRITKRNCLRAGRREGSW